MIGFNFWEPVQKKKKKRMLSSKVVKNFKAAATCSTQTSKGPSLSAGFCVTMQILCSTGVAL